MNVQLSDNEIIYLYGYLKNGLRELKSIKSKSIVKADIRLHQSIIENLEMAMPQLSKLPI